VLAPLRKKIGLIVRASRSGAAPISPDIIDYFQAIGIPLWRVTAARELGDHQREPPESRRSARSGCPSTA
jgi:hypothetical protein